MSRRKKEPEPRRGDQALTRGLVAQDAHNLFACHLDYVAPTERRDQCLRFIHERAQACPERSRRIRRLDLPALRQLADQELGVGANGDAVAAWILAGALDPPSQVDQSGDKSHVLRWVADTLFGGYVRQVVQADDLLLAGARFQRIGCIRARLSGSVLQRATIRVDSVLGICDPSIHRSVADG